MTDATLVKEHQWVKMVVTPIEVLPDGEGYPVVMVDPDKEEVSQNNASYGCFACSEPLENNLGTGCEAS